MPDSASYPATPLSLPPSGAAGGDLSGSYPNPSVAKIGGFKVGVSAVTLTSAQVLSCFTTPITIVAAPGAGLAIIPGTSTANYHFVTTPYTDHGGNLLLRWGTVQALNFGVTLGFWDQASSSLAATAGASRGPTALSGIANTALTITNSVANPTGGDGTLIVTVEYLIVPVS